MAFSSPSRGIIVPGDASDKRGKLVQIGEGRDVIQSVGTRVTLTRDVTREMRLSVLRSRDAVS